MGLYAAQEVKKMTECKKRCLKGWEAIYDGGGSSPIWFVTENLLSAANWFWNTRGDNLDFNGFIIIWYFAINLIVSLVYEATVIRIMCEANKRNETLIFSLQSVDQFVGDIHLVDRNVRDTLVSYTGHCHILSFNFPPTYSCAMERICWPLHARQFWQHY